MDTATTRLQLENILKMQACIPDVIASIMGISGMSYDPVSAGGSLALDEPGIKAVIRTQGIGAITTPLTDLCHEWARVRGHKLTSQDLASPARWLHGQTAWASINYPGWQDAQQTISEVHGKLGNITGWGPDRSDRQCPHCLTNKQLKQLGANHVRIQRWPTSHGNPDLWTCPTCHHAWIITDIHDGLADSEREVLSTQHIPVTQSTAARILGINRKTIHSWIRRGHLTTHNNKIYIDEASTLAQPATAW